MKLYNLKGEVSNKEEVSECCQAEPIESFKDNPRDHHDPFPIYVCEKCNQECDVIEIIKN